MPTPTTPPATPTTLLHAYRHLLRAALRAVQFSKPARYVVRDQIREGFELSGTTTKVLAPYDPERVRRTIWFLKAASQEAGLESRILKSLVRVAWERKVGTGPRTTWKGTLSLAKAKRAQMPPSVVVKTAYDHYDRTVKMLNDTMGLCLR